jgi:sodium-independent sulfate anion transporter 11
MALSRIGHFFAKALFINTSYRIEQADLTVSGANSSFSIATTANFVEEEPTVKEWIKKTLPTRNTAVNYIKSLFPFTAYILHYNLQWLIGDIIAGEHQVLFV